MLNAKWVNRTVYTDREGKPALYNSTANMLIFLLPFYQSVKRFLPPNLITEWEKMSPEYGDKYSLIFGRIIPYLDKIAPDGCTFGIHPSGDYRDWGFWEKDYYGVGESSS
jgi:hypothetical protein